MLTTRYMVSVKNLPGIFSAIQDGTAPAKFTNAHLKSVGFKSSNDVGVIPLLKELGFLSPEGVPTKRYHDYRDRTRARVVLGEALKQAYEELFHVKEKPSESDRAAIEGKFKATHNSSDRVAKEQAKTFFALLKLADVDAKLPKPPLREVDGGKGKDKDKEKDAGKKAKQPPLAAPGLDIGLRYNIEIHLPATKEPEVYNAIFKSLKEHLLEV